MRYMRKLDIITNLPVVSLASRNSRKVSNKSLRSRSVILVFHLVFTDLPAYSDTLGTRGKVSL